MQRDSRCDVGMPLRPETCSGTVSAVMGKGDMARTFEDIAEIQKEADAQVDKASSVLEALSNE